MSPEEIIDAMHAGQRVYVVRKLEDREEYRTVLIASAKIRRLSISDVGIAELSVAHDNATDKVFAGNVYRNDVDAIDAAHKLLTGEVE